MVNQTEIIRQIDTLLSQQQQLQSKSKYDDLSDLPDENVTALITSMCETIRRFAPPRSQYLESMKSLLAKAGVQNGWAIPHLAGVLKALRIAYDAGYIATFAELIHADVFADFIEMAEHLLSEGYKDPAAVVAGSLLEQHLRQLCMKSGILIEVSGRPKKADQLNADLAAQGVYSKLDQKSVTAWLDLRNKAAHGKYTEYTKEQVALLIQGIQNFITRIPA